MRNSSQHRQPAAPLPANSPAALVERQRNEGKKPNRLINEKSPYLLQHAFNPVDWFPWGQEAFEKARREDKPIFLSIGYSTCYWCHVMEREVFEDTAIARLMNEKLVCIKVDREERPDIDRVYMAAVQAMTGSGGWPMSVFMTSDRKPFFGGTYIPPRPQYGRPGFPDLVMRIDELWHHDRSKLESSGDQLTAMLKSQADSAQGTALTASVLDAAYDRCLASYDSSYGGFGGAPKFPRPSTLNFLLRYYARTGQEMALRMSLAMLRAIAAGGIHDHLGGGFHRYSVDAQWRVPHFEKMLYDQAQLVISYLEAYQITHDPTFADVARDGLAYVLGNLRDPQGGFYSAEDAESAPDASRPDEKEEGAFYLWTAEEIRQVLGKEDAAVVEYSYGVLEGGNALYDPQHVFTGKNILYAAHSVEETAAALGRPQGEIASILSGARATLLAARQRRPRPHLDDKIITAWNGLMISAFARAYQVLGGEEYLRAAVEAARFAAATLLDSSSGRLFRRYRDGDARYEGGLQDYAFFTQGLLDLYEASFDVRWLDLAAALTQRQTGIFGDTLHPGFFDNAGEDSTIIMRTKEDYDGAEPSGNSVAALNLLRLSLMTDNRQWRTLAEQTISAFGARLQQYPDIAPQMLAALAWSLSAPKEIIIAGEAGSGDTRALLHEVHARYMPDKIVLLLDAGLSRSRITSFLPFTADMRKLGGAATAYVCERYACQMPTSDPKVLARLLKTASVHE